MKAYILVVPALKPSGGVIEAVNLFKQLSGIGQLAIISLWKAEQEIDVGSGIDVHYLSQRPPLKLFAIFDIFMFLVIFRAFLKRYGNRDRCIFLTHYTTLVFRFLSSGSRFFIFVQGEEWRFSKGLLFRFTIGSFVLFVYRKTALISFSDSVRRALESLGLIPHFKHKVWADSVFYSRLDKLRDIKVVFMLRKGYAKRPDLTKTLILKFKNLLKYEELHVITPDLEYLEWCNQNNLICSFNPSKNQMAELYSISRVFIFLSETEGFGLPPLEAMASGCVPIVRDSGGPTAYMAPELSELLIPLERNIDEIFSISYSIINDCQKLKRLSRKCQTIYSDGVPGANSFVNFIT